MSQAKPPNEDVSNIVVAAHVSHMATEEAKREGEVEKLFAGVTGALSKVEEMLSQTSQEVYVHHLYGRSVLAGVTQCMLQCLCQQNAAHGDWAQPGALDFVHISP